MKSEVINLNEKLEMITKPWTPKIIEQMNDYHFKVVKILGKFTWHKHDETDETFFVVKGKMGIAFRDKTVTLHAGELYVIPKGVEHKPYAEKECSIMLIEPVGTVNTGDVINEMTKSNKDWI